MPTRKERTMTSRTPNQPTAWIKAIAIAVTVLFALVTIGARPAAADDAREAQQLVEKAHLTFDSFIADPHLGGNLRTLVNKARAVLIYPQVLRGAFIIGVSGGSGVLLVRDLASGKWGGPAFYTIGEVSFGLQAGGDASEVVLVALTDRGVSALLATSAKLGANASVAVGPVGAGLTGATANLSADIVSYSRNQGLYAGLSLEGAVVAVRGALNTAYYGREVTPTQILIQREVSNPQAASLISAVAKAASEPGTMSNSTRSSAKRSPRPSMSIARREAKWISASLRWAAQNNPPEQRHAAAPSSRSSAEPHTGQWVGICHGTAPSGRCSRTTRTTSGITSPARRTITVSPMRASSRATWSALCKVA